MNDRGHPERRVTQVLLEQRLREAERAHGAYEKLLGRRDDNWPAWYASYIVQWLPPVEPPTRMAW
jgi:hypothetical protein